VSNDVFFVGKLSRGLFGQTGRFEDKDVWMIMHVHYAQAARCGQK
jgi:hypothetical protein